MYCMPEEGTDLTPKDALLTTAEILRLVSFAMIVAMIVVVVLLAMLTKGNLIPHVYSVLSPTNVFMPAVVKTICGRRCEQNPVDRGGAHSQKRHCTAHRAIECPSRPTGNRHHH